MWGRRDGKYEVALWIARFILLQHIGGRLELLLGVFFFYRPNYCFRVSSFPRWRSCWGGWSRFAYFHGLYSAIISEAWRWRFRCKPGDLPARYWWMGYNQFPSTSYAVNLIVLGWWIPSFALAGYTCLEMMSIWFGVLLFVMGDFNRFPPL